MAEDRTTTILDPAATAFVRRLLLSSAIILIGLSFIATLGRLPLITHMFLIRQDIVIALSIAVLFIVATPFALRNGSERALFTFEPRHVGFGALAVAIVGVIGFHAILWGRDLSRDEQMAIFDARTFAAGHWVGSIPDAWLGFRSALNTVFMDPGLTGAAWASDYRPVNSALHAIGQLLGYAHIVGPLMGALALWATWRCARLLWPEERGDEAIAVTLVTLLLSAQFLLNTMTAYAMAPLLALNMVWLLLVWRDSKWAHAAALGIALLATGLHQVLYHPLFAFPVAAAFLVQRRWGLAAVYALAYPAFILFWETFSGMRADWADMAPIAAGAAAPPAGVVGGLWDEAKGLVAGFGLDSFATQAANLIRLLSWQHVAFVPLLIAGGVRAWRTRDTRLVTLVAIVVLTIIVKLLLRPDQGHGWGYRYLHGALGAMALLCGAGWIELRERGLAHARGFVALSLLTLVTIIPLRFYQAHAFSGVFARPALAAARSGADVVIVDNQAAPFAQDVVINDPFVRNHPVMLLASQITPSQVRLLCRTHRIGAVDSADLADVNAVLDKAVANTHRAQSDATMVAATRCRDDQRGFRATNSR